MKGWFRKAGFGLMIHWGLYALPAGEWKGARMKGIGEWLQADFRIPNAEYERLASAFHPIFFDAEEWADIAVCAGMKYMVVTAKHHDGFAMYRSAVDPYNVYDATPFHRDVIGELSHACEKRGLKFGLYYSQDLDWHEKNGGGYRSGHTNFIDGKDAAPVSWTNDWDFPNNGEKDFTEYFERKVKGQVTELLTGYGEIALIWFDTPMTLTKEQSIELYELVKRCQPDCLVNSRLGNGLGDYSSQGDNAFPEKYYAQGLAETPATLNGTWGYKSFDNNWKDVETVLASKRYLAEHGVNYLLNVGPDALGRIPAPAEQILRKVGEANSVLPPTNKL